MIGLQNPTQSYWGVGGGAYKTPHFLMRVVTKSILLVYCRDCLFFLNFLLHGIFPSYICNFISFNFGSFLIHILATYQ